VAVLFSPFLQKEMAVNRMEEDSIELTEALEANNSIDIYSENIPRNFDFSQKQEQKEENEMAEVDTTQLSQEHGAIRHDVAVESARLGAQIGAEACGINKHIGDMRQEDAENFGHTRRDIQSTSADIRQENAKNFADTRYASATQASDIRREGAEHTNEIIKEGLKEAFNTRGDVKDTRYDLGTRISNSTDRVVDRVEDTKDTLDDRFFTVGRDLADLKQGHATLSKDIELQALKSQLEAQKNTQFLSDKISLDGEKTRALINDHKYHDLNRALVERQSQLVACEQDKHHHRDRWFDERLGSWQNQFGAQFASMQSQLQSMNQNFNSQLSEARQGMVNFGTMAGVGQTSTNNNVR
jgi:hypothetical protein